MTNEIETMSGIEEEAVVGVEDFLITKLFHNPSFDSIAKINLILHYRD